MNKLREIKSDLPDHLSFRAGATGYENFILARAYLLALEEHRDHPNETDIALAINEFERDHREKQSWETLFYTIGGALFGLGLGDWLISVNATQPVYIAPFIFLTIIGLLLILAGFFEN